MKTFKPQFYDLRQTVKISFVVTFDDHKKLKAEAKRAGMTLPDFCRKKLNVPTAAELKTMRTEREKEYKKRNLLLTKYLNSNETIN
jgi:hypothetical protein